MLLIRHKGRRWGPKLLALGLHKLRNWPWHCLLRSGSACTPHISRLESSLVVAFSPANDRRAESAHTRLGQEHPCQKLGAFIKELCQPPRCRINSTGSCQAEQRKCSLEMQLRFPVTRLRPATTFSLSLPAFPALVASSNLV